MFRALQALGAVPAVGPLISALGLRGLQPLGALLPALAVAVPSPQQLPSLRHFAAAGAGAGAPPAQLLVVHPRSLPEYQLGESLRLAESFVGAPCPHVVVGHASRFKPSPSAYFGKGQVHAISHHALMHSASRVFVNAPLSGVQQRNLEAAWGLPVLDRVALIIEIFAQRARTREARLQVELASLEYKASRLVRVTDPNSGRRRGFGLNAETEVVSARERGRSGSSTGGLGAGGGGGESELELQRRRVAERRRMLLKRLEEESQNLVRRTRALQRAGRRRLGKPVVAVVGYTNAGKSSLVNALARADVGVEDRLFATLDPTLRRVLLPSGRDALLSDTVGFISDLPHQLVDAFQATLEEVTEADLLLHVLDASSPYVLEQREAVLQVLRELGIEEQQLHSRVIEVWNKADLVAVPASAVSKEQEQEQQSEEQQLAEQRRQQLPPHLQLVQQLLDSQTAALEAARRKRGGSRRGRPPKAAQPDAWDAAEQLRAQLLARGGGGGAAGGEGEGTWGEGSAEQLPIAVLTSATQRAGLAQLLVTVESKLALAMDTAELRRLLAKHGSRLVSDAVVPSFSAGPSAGDGARTATSRGLAAAIAAGRAGTATVEEGPPAGGARRKRGRRGAEEEQLSHWSDEVLTHRL